MAYPELDWHIWDDYFGQTIVKSEGTVIIPADSQIGEFHDSDPSSDYLGVFTYTQKYGESEVLRTFSCLLGDPNYSEPQPLDYYGSDVTMPDTQFKLIVRGYNGSSDCDTLCWEKVVTFIPYEGWMPSLSPISLASLPSVSLSLQSILRILLPISLSLPSLSLAELQNLFLLLSLSLLLQFLLFQYLLLLNLPPQIHHQLQEMQM